MPSKLVTLPVQSPGYLRSPRLSQPYHQPTKAGGARVTKNIKSVPATATIFLIVVHTREVSKEAQSFLETLLGKLRERGCKVRLLDLVSA